MDAVFRRWPLGERQAHAGDSPDSRQLFAGSSHRYIVRAGQIPVRLRLPCRARRRRGMVQRVLRAANHRALFAGAASPTTPSPTGPRSSRPLRCRVCANGFLGLRSTMCGCVFVRRLRSTGCRRSGKTVCSAKMNAAWCASTLAKLPLRAAILVRRPVPPRDPLTGAILDGFQKRFTQLRESTLPEWSPRERFDHFYRFSTNTRVASSESNKHLRVGDSLRLT